MNLLKNKLFLLALVTMLALSMGAFIAACSGGDDDDDDDDDDDNDDDTWNDDDDVDDDIADDDTGDDDSADDDDDDDDDAYTCESIADGMINNCGVSYGTMDAPALTAWCEECEEFMAAKLASPFWTCLGDAVFVEFCDQAAFGTCDNPGDPGSGCGSTVHGVYGCGVAWVFESDNFIPEMDMQAACESLTDWPWDCFGDCVAAATCADPPTEQNANDMIACLNTCETK